MSLHVDYYQSDSSAAPLLLIHGWGMHGGMWSGVAEQLAQNHRVMAVDLPGHGYSAFPVRLASARDHGTEFIDAIVEQLSAQFDEPLSVCGWSLGGQVALRWALLHPQQVKRLVMVASTPCFVRLDDWKYALSVEILEEFANNLGQNYALTLKRFLSLQMRGSDHEREILAILREDLFSRGEPDLAALQVGLEILRSCDQRAALPQVRQAALILAGERDTLIPHQATQYLADNIPSGRLQIIKGAAHAPFLSHREEFLQYMNSFLHEK